MSTICKIDSAIAKAIEHQASGAKNRTTDELIAAAGRLVLDKTRNPTGIRDLRDSILVDDEMLEDLAAIARLGLFLIIRERLAAEQVIK